MNLDAHLQNGYETEVRQVGHKLSMPKSMMPNWHMAGVGNFDPNSLIIIM